MADATPTTPLDIGALAWVRPALEETWNLADAHLAQWLQGAGSGSTSDAPATADFDAAAAAWMLVGDEPASRLSRVVGAAVERLRSQPEWRTPTGGRAVLQAVRLLRQRTEATGSVADQTLRDAAEWIQQWLDGAPTETSAGVGGDTSGAAVAEAAAVPVVRNLPWLRQRYQQGLLLWLRNTDAREGLGEMAAAVGALARRCPPETVDGLLWRSVSALLDALAQGRLPVDAWVKRLCGLVDRQLGRLQRGQSPVAAALLPDVLSRLQTLPDVYAMLPPLAQRFVPRLGEVACATEPEEPAQWRAAVRQAQEAWTAVCQGAADGVARWTAALRALGAMAHSEQITLVRALDGATCAFPSPPEMPVVAPVLQEEVAQALVLIEPWAPPVDDEQALSSWRATRQRVVNRLMAVAYPTDPELMPEEEANAPGWSGAAGADLRGAVIDAVLAAARPIEQAFSSAAAGDAASCKTVEDSARQMAGAFAMLGAKPAADRLYQVERVVAQWAARQPSPADVQVVSDALAAAVWYAEQLRTGVDDPSVFDGIVIPAPPPGDDTAVGAPAAVPLAEEVDLDGHRLPTDLYRIFLEEARVRLRELAAAVEAVCAHATDTAVWEPLVRVAHTLAGMARTTALTPIAELAYALELWALRCYQVPGALPAQAPDVLRRIVGSLQDAVAVVESRRYPAPMSDVISALADLPVSPPAAPALMEGAPDDGDVREARPSELSTETLDAPVRHDDGAPPTPAATSVATPVTPDSPGAVPSISIAAARMAVPAAAPPSTEQVSVVAPALPTDEIDAELLPVFLEEAQDWMPRIQSTVQQWRDHPGVAEHSAALQRALHTLKGAARMVGAMAIGQRIHELEADVQALGTQMPTPDWLDAVQQRVDQVHDAIEALTSGPAPSSLSEPVPPTAQMPVVPAAAPPTDGEGQANGLAPAAGPSAAAPSATVITPEPAADAAPAAAAQSMAAAEAVPDDAGRHAVIRLSTERLDELLNDAGEVAIARSRLEALFRRNREVVQELADHVDRLRTQLRELEIQAESQMHARLARADRQEFDPLEFDRFTRLQELTRLLAESVNDVETTRDMLLAGFDEVDDALLQQARVNRSLQDGLMRARMVPLRTIEDRLHRVLRRAAKETDRRAHLEVDGRDLEVDRAVLDRLVGPLEHLIRNAVAHGIEPPAQRQAAGKSAYGEVRLRARREASEVVIELTDDGRGIDLAAVHARAESLGWVEPGQPVDPAQCYEWLFRTGFSTAAVVTELAGRGVGLDVVRSDLADMGGRVSVSSEPGRGTRFELRLPQTLGVAAVVLVRAGGQTWALPAGQVHVLREVSQPEFERLRQAGGVTVGERMLPLASLEQYLPPRDEDDLAPHDPTQRLTLLLVQAGDQQWVMAVEAIDGQLDAVLKPIGPLLARVPGVAGATVLGDGRVALILDAARLLARSPRKEASGMAAQRPTAEAQRPPLVFVVDDSLTVRKVTSRFLVRHGYRVETAKDGQEALERLQRDPLPAVMLLDIEMPNMDGFEVTQRVRAEARTASLPIIMITSRTADKHREHARTLGVDVYLGKPYQEETLLGHIERLAGPPHVVGASA
ncbi:Hpt domain-containing protein [Tepidimonas taiwanensis]|uniref:Chemotaxis protein CheA n=1 Tax=Tepidimonas taiwanensis TaxID=307486 RepID=A0A554X4T7_9BURK|nr:Hpt domain-containing protein [Tepidimonas taiwanensis]MDM7463216.1 Hpt domain-containing protein [Tepidimonas taiwanensis]TSE30835.1 Chemotaxis protein CheA [Tepidimonas taiwanensis]UBQ05108.1 Hpt domain-containing protein [Tepidimonas taiwanensis]